MHPNRFSLLSYVTSIKCFIAMKKYLVKGALALFGGAFLFSCAEKEADYVPIVEQKVKAYEDVFKEVYGDIDPYQNWGFTNKVVLADESTSEVVYVDSIMSEPYEAFARARTRTADPRGNMWADEGWNVPPVISDPQKNIVRQYFQQNRIKQYNDPGWSNFWIQQVYKGGSNTKDSQTTESYTIGNDDDVVGGDHMDHLCSKSASGTEDHINDFNNSDNNDWEGRMLMVNSSTNSFGYINSNASAIHYDKASLVNWRVIAQWAVSKGLESSVESSVLNDGWNRSYMGFDWEQALPGDCYSRNITYGSWVSPENRIEGREYTSDGVEILSVTYNTFEFEGNTYRFLSANSNQYAYDQTETTFGGKKNYNDRPDDATIRQLLSLGYLPYSDTLKDWIKLSTGADGYYSDWIVTLTEAKKRTSEPYEDPHIQEKSILVETQSGRIFCEDLGVSTREDLDFNDVVFDVYVWMNYKEGYIDHYIKYSDGTKELQSHEEYSTLDQATYTCRIVLQAAGGTIPVTVAGQDVHSAFREGNAPVSHTTMINTYDNNTTAFGDFAECASVDLGVLLGKPNGLFTPTTLFPGSSKYTSDKVCIEALDIPIVVKYGNGTNGVGELGNSLGGAPAKIFVPNYDTRWTVERKPLSLAYPKFPSYVKPKEGEDRKDIMWWDDSDLSPAEVQRASYYRHGNPIGSSTAKPPIVITRFIYPASTEKYLWTGTESYGSWTLKDPELNLDAFYGENKDRKEKPFYPGDRIRFYASGLKDDSYITVVYADLSKPYFIDAPFPNFKVDNKGGLILDEEGNKIPVTSGVIEVVLDEENAKKMNETVLANHKIQVQGRNFILKYISIVPFE